MFYESILSNYGRLHLIDEDCFIIFNQDNIDVVENSIKMIAQHFHYCIVPLLHSFG